MNRRYLISSFGVGIAALSGCSTLVIEDYDLEVINFTDQIIAVSISIHQDGDTIYDGEVQVSKESGELRESVAPPGTYTIEAQVGTFSSSTTIGTQGCREPKAYVIIENDRKIEFDQKNC
jgi:hypothetical protein